MIKVGLIALGLMLVTACGDSEPVSTSYKKTIAAGGAAPGAATGTAQPATGDATALKAQGTTLYGSKCAPCHGALATSQKKGATGARITASATISSHSTVSPFPTGTDVTALEAALK